MKAAAAIAPANQGRQDSARTARGIIGKRSPNRPSASRARCATKSVSVAPSPTTSAAARLAQARSPSDHSACALSAVSKARTATISSALNSVTVYLIERVSWGEPPDGRGLNREAGRRSGCPVDEASLPSPDSGGIRTSPRVPAVADDD